mmetsp:Transcript_4328/g.7001  ORF Transcript_4328/g.7001 Transcript_4328/m.7001 type:complete len:242 (-) Transcript_4328:323-1048(-)
MTSSDVLRRSNEARARATISSNPRAREEDALSSGAASVKESSLSLWSKESMSTSTSLSPAMDSSRPGDAISCSLLCCIPQYRPLSATLTGTARSCARRYSSATSIACRPCRSRLSHSCCTLLFSLARSRARSRSSWSSALRARSLSSRSRSRSPRRTRAMPTKRPLWLSPRIKVDKSRPPCIAQPPQYLHMMAPRPRPTTPSLSPSLPPRPASNGPDESAPMITSWIKFTANEGALPRFER